MNNEALLTRFKSLRRSLDECIGELEIAMAAVAAKSLDTITNKKATAVAVGKPSCHTCLLFQPSLNSCIRHGRIPIEFINAADNGCPDYDLDDIPF